MDIFISYSRVDRIAAKLIANELIANGFTVWLDVDGIAGGSNWLEEIERAIASASSIIVLLSATSIESKFVLQEIYYAYGLKKLILPILLGDINWPDIPLILSRIQFLDLRQGVTDAGISKLLAALESHELDKLLQFPPSSAPVPSADEIKKEEEKVKNSPLPHRVFIAYSRRQRSNAFELAELLTRNGKAVFYDAKIRAGALRRKKIQKALDDATHLVVLWTQDAASSDEVEREVSYALSEHKVIVPLLSKDIPKLPYHLHGLHYIVFSDDLSSIEVDLLKAIDHFSDSEDLWQ